MEEKDLLRAADVARLLDLTPGRIYQMIKRQQLPAVRVAGRIRIPAGAWRRWLEEQETRALAAVRRDPD